MVCVTLEKQTAIIRSHHVLNKEQVLFTLPHSLLCGGHHIPLFQQGVGEASPDNRGLKAKGFGLDQLFMECDQGTF